MLLVGFTLLGVICFAALGVAFSHVIPNEESAPAYTNAIFLPLIFISGVFYSADDLPAALEGDRGGAAAEAPDRRPLGRDRGWGRRHRNRRAGGGRVGGRGAIPGRALLPLGVGRSACPCRRSHASCSRQAGQREASSRQKRCEWSCTSRCATSCSTT